MSNVNITLAQAQKLAFDAVQAIPGGFASLYEAGFVAQQALAAGWPPVPTSVDPDTGSSAGGDAITITGSGFTGATSAAIGAADCTSFVVVSDTEITCVTPANADGTYDLTVTGPNGIGTLPAAFTTST